MVAAPSLSEYLAWLLLVILALALCGNVLFSSDRIFGAPGTDMDQQFIAWRHFGFSELAAGRLPLWNPHVFVGAPYLGGFQAALFYPLNWPLFFLLDTRQAINASITLHFALMGVFTCHWLRNSGISIVAATLGGALAMLCGAYAAHVYAGHMPNMCAMVWFPLQLLAIDQVLHTPWGQRESLRHTTSAVILGGVAIAMQILAGHPQYVFISAFALGLYTLAQGIATRKATRAAVMLGIVASLGAALSAVQLLPGTVANMETVRGRALPEEFAAMFSLPIENLWTLVLPEVMGGRQPGLYFGRWYWWEMSLYMGWGVVLLAIAGGWRSSSVIVARRLALVFMGLVSLILALGSGTPLHHWLYQYLPGFDRIRGMSKYAFVCAPVVAYMAATGYDNLTASGTKRLAWWAAGLALTMLVLAWIVQGEAGQGVVERLAESRQSYFLERAAQAQDVTQFHSMVLQLAKAMSAAFFRGGLELLFWTALLVLLIRRLAWKPIVPVLAVLQLLWWAWGAVAFASYDQLVARWDLPEHDVGADYRVANHTNKNSGLYTGAFDVSGNDPGVTTRYAELMAMLQGENPDQATQYIDVQAPHPLHTLLRLKFVRLNLQSGPGEWLRVQDPPMPRFTLVDGYSLRNGRDAVLERMLEPSFDPHKEVVLEQAPSPIPQLGARGRVQLEACGTDSCTVQVQLDRPALLLMTDAWTPSWRATSAHTTHTPAQENYELMPGDYAMRVVPLAAGQHAITIYHSRDALHIGATISALAVLVVIMLAAWCSWSKAELRLRAGIP